MAKKTIQEFIQESELKHPNKYSYDRCFEYVNNKTKIELFCKSCNVYFKTTANDHLGKKLSGCPSCGLKNRVARKSSMTYQKLLESSVEKHGAIYTITDDSNIYPGNYKLTLTCSIHGEFNVSVYEHIRKDKLGGGCQECSLDKRRIGSTTINNYIVKASEHFQNKYSYSNIDINNIKNINQKVDIECPVHGNFQQSFKVHFILLSDCNKCSKSLTEEDINQSIIKFSPKHIDTKNINLFYKNDSNFVKDLIVKNLLCINHDIKYETSYRNLIGLGVGCPSCKNKSTSQYELEIINLIKDLGYKEDIFQSYRPDWLNGKELDIFIPELNTAIEFNGSVFHHSSKSENINSFLLSTFKEPSYHYNKWKTCFDNGVKLISIYDFYWHDLIKKEIYKSKIKHALGFDTRVYARNCIIREVSNIEAKSFFNTNHIEGFGFSYKNLKSYGLYYNNTLVMCSSIGEIYNQSSKSWVKKLQRICTLKEITVVGGVSKLTKYLLRNEGDFKYQITLDSGGSILNNYDKDLSKVTLRYYWVDPVTFKFHYRNYCQKQKLEKHFNIKLNTNDTENSYMERLGYLKIYDSGITELQIK